MCVLALQRREAEERDAVDVLEKQLHSRQKVQEHQQTVAELEKRLTDLSSDIVSMHGECQSLQTEYNNLISPSKGNQADKIARNRYLPKE